MIKLFREMRKIYFCIIKKIKGIYNEMIDIRHKGKDKEEEEGLINDLDDAILYYKHYSLQSLYQEVSGRQSYKEYSDSKMKKNLEFYESTSQDGLITKCNNDIINFESKTRVNCSSDLLNKGICVDLTSPMAVNQNKNEQSSVNKVMRVYPVDSKKIPGREFSVCSIITEGEKKMTFDDLTDKINISFKGKQVNLKKIENVRIFEEGNFKLEYNLYIKDESTS